MTISVILCTRSRGSLIEETIRSIQAGTLQPDELLVIDQSDDHETGNTVRKMAGEWPVIRYLQTQTRGLSRARNIGLSECVGDIIAFTDDDVVVSSGWLQLVREEFDLYPDLGLLFGAVLPPETYHWQTEFIPHVRLNTVRSIRWYQREAMSGIGANMVLHRRTYELLGGFSEVLGAGTGAAGEDYEYTLRSLCHSSPVSMHTLKDAYIVHYAGARSGPEYHKFVHQVNGLGMGLYWAYLLKQKNIKYVVKFLQYNTESISGFLRSLAHGKKPSGMRTYFMSLKGLRRGLFQTLPLR